MKENRKRPAGSETRRGDMFLVETAKDIPKISNRQTKVLNLLKRGKYSAADITIALGLCDPRSYIRELRYKGFNILDEWVQNEDTRYKKYWI